jgi:hypothetical protein
MFSQSMDSLEDDTEAPRRQGLQLEELGLSSDELDDLPDKEPNNSSAVSPSQPSHGNSD